MQSILGRGLPQPIPRAKWLLAGNQGKPCVAGTKRVKAGDGVAGEVGWGGPGGSDAFLCCHSSGAAVQCGSEHLGSQE